MKILQEYKAKRTLLSAALLVSLTQPAFSATDYAMKMEKAATATHMDIATAGERVVAVGQRGHILYSTDEGNSWTQADVPVSVLLTRTFFASTDKGWVVGHDGHILHTQDGGVTWELQREGLVAQALINEERAGRLKQAVADLESQLEAAPEEEQEALAEALDETQWNLESALEKLDEPAYAPPLMDIWFENEEQGWASGAYGVLLHTHNGGREWQDWSHNVGNVDELHLNGVTGATDGTLYLASEWGTVFRSTSDGHTWETLETGYEGSFFGVITNPVTNTVFAYGLRGTIYRSTDGGETWEAMQSKARASLFGATAHQDGTVIFVGQGGQATLTRDDGDTFTALPQHSRAGLHGIAPLGENNYMVTGDGGSRKLVMEVAK